MLQFGYNFLRECDCMAETKSDVLTYKGHPLRRIDNMIFYGSMADKYIIMMQVLENREENGLKMASRVAIQLQQTEPGLKATDRIVKHGEKGSLYEAMDFASIWLERALAGRLG